MHPSPREVGVNKESILTVVFLSTNEEGKRKVECLGKWWAGGFIAFLLEPLLRKQRLTSPERRTKTLLKDNRIRGVVTWTKEDWTRE